MAEQHAPVVITGASTGIGAACAVHLATLGHRVFAGVRRQEDGTALASRARGIAPLMLDVTDQRSIDEAAARVEAEVGAGGLGGLVNNAGIGVGGPMEFMPLDRMRHQFEVNVFGQVAVTQAFLPLLRRARGRIVNMSSIAGLHSPPFYGPYAGSKHALEAVSDALRLELAPWGMHVSIVEPGSIATPIWDKGIAMADDLLEQLPEHGQALYRPFADAMRKATADTRDRGIPPERVAEAVAHALRARRPKTRYLVGRDARVQALLTKLLPNRLFDRLIARSLGLPRRP